jgi:hypothetical protein
MESRIIFLIAAVIFLMLGGSSISVVHASILGDFKDGYDAGKTHAINDFSNNYLYNNSCHDSSVSSGSSTDYCSGYSAGYDSEWAKLTNAQP